MSGRRRKTGGSDGAAWGSADAVGDAPSIPFEVLPTEQGDAPGLSAPRIPTASRADTERPSIEEPALPDSVKPSRWDSVEEKTQIDFKDSSETDAAPMPSILAPNERAPSISKVVTEIPEVVAARGIVIGPTDGSWSDDEGEAKTIAPGMLIVPESLRRPKPPAKAVEPAIIGPSKRSEDPPVNVGPPKGKRADAAPVIIGPPKGKRADEPPMIAGPPKGRRVDDFKGGSPRPIDVRETRREAGHSGIDPRMAGPAYRVIREIAVGGMGTVFEAERVSDRHKVALKILNANVAKDDRIKERLRREVEAARKIEHRGVVEMYGFETAPDGRAFAVMELLDGVELRLRLREGKLDVARACTIAAEVCDVLAVAHSKGIIHRDVKPENIFLMKDPNGERVKLLDFGAANVLDAKTLTVEGSMIGTPAYMAPEQVLGDEVSERTDVYSAALVLYEALSGQQPFRTERFEETIVRVVGAIPPPPTGVAAIDEIVLKGLEKQAVNRWPSAAAFAEALRSVARGQPSAGAWRLAWQRRFRSKAMRRIALGGLVIGLASSVGYLAGDRTAVERIALSVRAADAQGCSTEDLRRTEQALNQALSGVADVEIEQSEETLAGVAALQVSCQRSDPGLRVEAVLLAASGGSEEARVVVRGKTAQDIGPRIATTLAVKKGWRTSATLRKQSDESSSTVE